MAQTVERDAYVLKEVADRVGPVSMRTVYNWIDRGLLRVTNIAGRRMVLRRDLEEFLAAAQQQPASPRPPSGRAKDLAERAREAA